MEGWERNLMIIEESGFYTLVLWISSSPLVAWQGDAAALGLTTVYCRMDLVDALLVDEIIAIFASIRTPRATLLPRPPVGPL